jgi:3-hydroxyacyl-[acyl-carrier-protein] dehydratase
MIKPGLFPGALPSRMPLPHRYPILLIDRITAWEEGCWIRATRALSANDPLLTDEGTLPAPLLIESIAQAAAALLLYSRPGLIPALVGIDRARFSGEAKAGDSLQLYAEVCWLRKQIGRARGRALSASGILLCETEFTFAWSLRTD